MRGHPRNGLPEKEPVTEELRADRRAVALETYRELATLLLGLADLEELSVTETLRVLLAKVESGEG